MVKDDCLFCTHIRTEERDASLFAIGHLCGVYEEALEETERRFCQKHRGLVCGAMAALQDELRSIQGEDDDGG